MARMNRSAKQDVTELERLRALLAEKEAMIAAQSGEITWLKEQLGLSRLSQFGPSSEKYPAQNDLFNEAETCDEEPAADATPEAESIAGYQRKKPGRKPLPKDLPRERVVHDLADSEKVCDCCGGELHAVGEETSEQLDIVPAKVRVLEHVKIKYGCRGCEKRG